MKQCRKCKRILSIDNFYHNKYKKDGYSIYCKKCSKEIKQQWKDNNRDRFRLLKRQSYLRNKKKILEYNTLWLKNNYKVNPIIQKAHYLLARAVEKGIIKKENCSVCGKEASGHHFNYSKPLEAVWFCLLHHKELHRKLVFDREKLIYNYK